MILRVQVNSRSRSDLIDITGNIRDLVRGSKVQDGICFLYMPHTTAGILINENADPSVARDILNDLERIIPWDGHYQHREGNAAAHIKSSIIGSSEIVFIEAGELALGTWQGIYLAEFDGPRQRNIWVKFFVNYKKSSNT
jgi:secondary thiamine-phosphate synthase enzyme